MNKEIAKRYTNTFLKKSNFEESGWRFWKHWEKVDILLLVIDSNNEIYECAKSKNQSKMRDRTKGRDFSDPFSMKKFRKGEQISAKTLRKWTNRTVSQNEDLDNHDFFVQLVGIKYISIMTSRKITNVLRCLLTTFGNKQ